MPGERNRRLALVALLGLAAANFLWQLGSSSYYVDEVEAVRIAAHPLGRLLHAIARNEISPPAYFAFLHEWIGHTSTTAPSVARLPSAVCGVALVAAVYWLASLMFEDRWVPLVAAGLTALSPFVLEYAQLAQEYVFVMLAATVAVAASIEADRAQSHRGWWLLGAGAATIVTLWLHYTGGLIVIALCVWIATRRALPARWRVAFVGCCLVAGLALVPLLVSQHQAIPSRTGVEASAAVTSASVQRIIETPLDGRVDALRWLGVLVIVAAFGWLIACARRRPREPALLIALAGGIPLVLTLLSALGASLMLTRYASVAAPFMILVIAAAAVGARPQALRAVIGAGALAVIVAGLVASHQSSGFYLDARSVSSYVRSHEQPGDLVFERGGPGITIPLGYYGLTFQPLGTPTEVALARSRRHRVWAIYGLTSPVPTDAVIATYARLTLGASGYRVMSIRVFPGVVPLGVVLEQPIGR